MDPALILRFVFAIGVLAGLLAMLRFTLTAVARDGFGRHSRVARLARVVERVAFGPGTQVLVLEIAGSYHLIGSTAQNVGYLAALDREAIARALHENSTR